MPVGFAAARKVVFHKIGFVAALLGHENLSSQKVAKLLARNLAVQFAACIPRNRHSLEAQALNRIEL